jgi:hypothetical protein
MADYFAGQQFFNFYPGEPEEDEEVSTTSHSRDRR